MWIIPGSTQAEQGEEGEVLCAEWQVWGRVSEEKKVTEERALSKEGTHREWRRGSGQEAKERKWQLKNRSSGRSRRKVLLWSAPKELSLHPHPSNPHSPLLPPIHPWKHRRPGGFSMERAILNAHLTRGRPQVRAGSVYADYKHIVNVTVL